MLSLLLANTKNLRSKVIEADNINQYPNQE